MLPSTGLLLLLGLLEWNEMEWRRTPRLHSSSTNGRKHGCPSVDRRMVVRSDRVAFQYVLGTCLPSLVSRAHRANIPEFSGTLEQNPKQSFFPTASVLFTHSQTKGA